MVLASGRLANVIHRARHHDVPVGAAVPRTEAEAGHWPDAGPGRLSVCRVAAITPAAQLADIFRPFYQADSTRNQQGSGIGLSLVKELVELQDGEISVESVVGEGTTFEMVLPSPLAWKAEVEEAVESVPEISPDGQSPLVLIADDNADYRKLLALLFPDT